MNSCRLAALAWTRLPGCAFAVVGLLAGPSGCTSDKGGEPDDTGRIAEVRAAVALPADCEDYALEDWVFHRVYLRKVPSNLCEERWVDPTGNAALYRQDALEEQCQVVMSRLFDPCVAHSCTESRLELVEQELAGQSDPCDGAPEERACGEMFTSFRSVCVEVAVE